LDLFDILGSKRMTLWPSPSKSATITTGKLRTKK
jgi:hypothetical protein